MFSSLSANLQLDLRKADGRKEVQGVFDDIEERDLAEKPTRRVKRIYLSVPLSCFSRKCPLISELALRKVLATKALLVA
ncbi:MAG: hypothetical protein VR65_00905 [Desulfobulbaceae bacterium BRH_c16a]|nr:MAG: hypothetical protein VR65_00905 [Desulfobulbaceae bacterium BRH_c16a]